MTRPIPFANALAIVAAAFCALSEVGMRFFGRDFSGESVLTPLAVALVLWLCALALLVLVALPFLGGGATLALALLLLAADVLLCWLLFGETQRTP